MDAQRACRNPSTDWAAAIVVVLGSLTLALAGCGSSPATAPVEQIDQARNAAAKAEILVIETGIRAYQAMNGSLPADASQMTLGRFVIPWPKNPWTQAPMQPGAGKGDYTYAQTNDGFTLTVHLDGGNYSRP